MVNKHKRSKDILSTRKIELYDKNAEILEYWRKNPCIAAEALFGVKLFDAQKYLLNQTWNKQYNVWTASRNFGKSFLAGILIGLKWMLFEDQQIYIIGSTGSQSIQAFKKIEDIAMQRVASCKSLKDVFATEAKKSPACKTGFIHNPSSHTVYNYNESGIFTLNGDPDNNRSRRATFVFFDESAFSSEELLISGIAFATQSTDFSTSTDEGFDPRMEFQKTPTQLLFASSMNDTECLFYKKFKEYSLNMFMGDTNYFTCSIPCVIPLNPLMDGEPYAPLLKQSQIDGEMKVNPQKALREYYNKPMADHQDQMIRNAIVIRNSILALPILGNQNNKEEFIVAIDTARSGDNSIFGAMKVYRDPIAGLCGEIANFINFIDIPKKKKMNLKIDEQTDLIKENILKYNGKNPDYLRILGFLADSGSGGQGTSVADLLLHDYTDSNGIPHIGFIDETHDLYKEDRNKYPDASRCFNLVNPQKYKNQMCVELIELLEHDIIKFPKEYDGKESIVVEFTNEKGEIELKDRELSLEEKKALINIDILKSELLGVHKIYNNEGNVIRYEIPNEHSHDDRFYVLLLLCHKLYELRRRDLLNSDSDFYEDEQLVFV